jgi:spermidine synthase
MGRVTLLGLFALSGAAALVYEVVWTRLLTLQFGHGVAAASTVLAAFMGGLAVGAAAGGRIGQRLTPASALRAYAVLELAIAAAAVLLPFLLRSLQPLLAMVYANGDGGTAFAALRFGTSLVLLWLPAAAMGATFPVASRWMVRGASSMSDDAGRLYAANTLGAAAGALAAGFVLLPTVGLAGATAAGVFLNVAAAAGAWRLASTSPPASEPRASAGRAKPRRRIARVIAGRPLLAATALGVTGLASLTLQVVWTRLLAAILGPTTYAFSIVVAIFILGIAGGAAAAARLSRRISHAEIALGVTVLLAGGLALLAAAGVDRTLLAVAHLVAAPDATFQSVLSMQVVLAAALLLPMALAFGAAFPLAVAVASRTDDTAVTDLGYVYAANTVGAIAGALASGFVLIPWIGLHNAIRLVATVTAVAGAGLALAARGSRGRQTAALGLAAAILAGAWLAPSWDPRLLSSGAYKYAPTMRGPDLQTALTAGELRFYREGATATVAVRELAGSTSLSIDGKVDASDAADMLTQRLLAHVPLLLHPQPKSALVLGLGSGVTLGSALTHGLDRGVVLEISPEVVEASRFFEVENHGVLDDRRTRLIVGDGRTHLLLSEEQFDVIVSEPSNPWMAGIASLFTREFFEVARARLAPGGVLCQWAHTYDISEGDLRSIVATFLEVFPHGTLWLVGEADVLLLGSTEPLTERLAGIPAAWQRPGVAADLAGVGALDPTAIYTMFIADGPALAAWTSGAPIQTDDLARLEFSGPRSIFGVSQYDNAKTLRELASSSRRPPVVERAVTSATADQWREVGEMLRRADSYATAYDHFIRAIERNPSDAEALNGLVQSSAPLGRNAATRDLLTRLSSDPIRIEARIALSRLLAAEGGFDEAARLALTVVQSRPGYLPALEQLASVLTDAGDAERLAPVVARLKADAPGTATTHYYAAALAFLQQRPQQAIHDAEAALRIEPDHARARNILGAALAGLGERDKARAAFTASINADPRDPATYSNLATLELESGNRGAAQRYFAEALVLDPTNAVAREGLASLHR